MESRLRGNDVVFRFNPPPTISSMPRGPLRFRLTTAQPLATLLRIGIAPLLAKRAPLFRRQGLKPLKRRAQFLPLFRRHLPESAHVLAKLLAFFGRHVCPALQTFPDLLLSLRWQARPALRVVGELLLALRRQAIPLSAQRCKLSLLLW